MHDRAARPTGAVKSAAAIAIESVILLNIDLRITRVRPRVEESVHRVEARFEMKWELRSINESGTRIC